MIFFNIEIQVYMKGNWNGDLILTIKIFKLKKTRMRFIMYYTYYTLVKIIFYNC